MISEPVLLEAKQVAYNFIQQVRKSKSRKPNMKKMRLSKNDRLNFMTDFMIKRNIRAAFLTLKEQTFGKDTADPLYGKMITYERD